MQKPMSSALFTLNRKAKVEKANKNGLYWITGETEGKSSRFVEIKQ